VTLTHCPHCGKALFDERLDEQGYPRLDTVWEMDDGRGPAAKLTVQFIEPGNRLGREIRGTIMYRTKKEGTEYNEEGAAPYATDYKTFYSTWNYQGEKDMSQIVGELGI
jgi:hypothetical protein